MSDVLSLPRSSTGTFDPRDYADPFVVNGEFNQVYRRLERLEDNLQKSVNGLKTEVDDRFNKMQKNVDERFDKMQKSVDERFDNMQKSVDERFDNMQKDVNGLKTEVEGLKTEVTTGFATLEAMIKKLVAHNTQPAGTAPPSIQGVPSSLSDDRGSADGLPPSSVVPDAGHVSPTPSVPHSSSSVQGGSSSVQHPLPSLQGSSPTSSVEGFYSSSPVQFARTYADSSEEAGPSVTQAQAMSDLPAIALHAAEVLDTVQRETESSIGKLKKLTSMISFKNLRK